MDIAETPITDIPTDWLEAFCVLVDEDSEFAEEIKAIYRMRDIEQRDGVHYIPDPGAAQAELARREERPWEAITRLEANKVIREAFGWKFTQAARLLNRLSPVMRRGRQMYFLADIEAVVERTYEWPCVIVNLT